MKQVIYSEHHRGIVEYPLLTEPKKMDYVRTGAVGAYVTNGFVVAIEIYNKWLSSPPIAQVPKEFIEFFSVPRGESEYEIKGGIFNVYTGFVGINEEREDDSYVDWAYHQIKMVAIPIKEADLEPSQLQLGKPVVSHSCTVGNSIEQEAVAFVEWTYKNALRLGDDTYRLKKDIPPYATVNMMRECPQYTTEQLYHLFNNK